MIIADYSLIFSIERDDNALEPTAQDFRKALLIRIACLDDAELLEAVGDADFALRVLKPGA